MSVADLLIYLPFLFISVYSVLLVSGGIWFGVRLATRLWVRDERIITGNSDAEIPDHAGGYDEMDISDS